MEVNLNCIDVYAALERANDRKLHVFATKHEANSYSEHLIHSHDDVLSWPPLKFMTSHLWRQELRFLLSMYCDMDSGIIRMQIVQMPFTSEIVGFTFCYRLLCRAAQTFLGAGGKILFYGPLPPPPKKKPQ